MNILIKTYVVLSVCLLLVVLPATSFANQKTAEIVDRTSLRVCADPSNLPFSNKESEGFENKIAELLGEYLSLPVEYTWFPQSQGFVRSTLIDFKCDIIIGISAAHGLVLNTNAYYSSIFSLVTRKENDKTFTTLSDPSLKDFGKIGLIAGTSPTSLMLKFNLIDQMAPYHLFVDTREGTANDQMIKDLLAKKLDAGILWGPMAGYHVSKHEKKLHVFPLFEDDSEELRIVYRITMGVRPGEVEWKRLINKFIKEKQVDINTILENYGVPLVK